MKRSASLALAALLALSLGVKLLANTAPPAADAAVFDAAAAAMLEKAGFAASREARPFGTVHHGTRGACRLMLAEYDPHGTFAELFRRLAAPVGTLRFAWRGRLADRAPKTEALVRFYLWRELRRVRIAAPREPLAGWAATPGCDTSQIEWSRIARLPA